MATETLTSTDTPNITETPATPAPSAPDTTPTPPPKRTTWFARFKLWVNKNITYLSAAGVSFMILLVFTWPRVFIVISSGEGGVLYKLFENGTVTNVVYEEGLHLINPFNTMTIYNARVQIILHDFSVLTNQGLPITLRLAVRFRPIYDLLGVLHKDVGPDYPNKIILPQIESVLRKRIGSLSPEDVYTNKEGILNEIIAQAIEEVGQKFVIIDEIIIRTVTLPQQVRDAIDSKLVYEQQFLAYDYILKKESQEAERKRIESKGIKDYQTTLKESLDKTILDWHGIEATLELAKSNNAKIVIIGSGEKGLPLILDMNSRGGDSPAPAASETADNPTSPPPVMPSTTLTQPPSTPPNKTPATTP